MKKNILIPILIASAIVLIAGAGVGGFFGGKAYERNQANQTRNNFLRERGIQGFDPNNPPSGNLTPGQNGGTFTGGGFGRGATGQIKSIDGNTITLTEGQTEVKVTLSDTTRIEKSTAASTADLQAGLQVTITGQRDSSGNITASQVLILGAAATPISSGTTP